ncbi:MAG: putative immunity protein [Nitrososphaerales archaeon]
MERTKKEKIRSFALLCEFRQSVSEILDLPFTERIDHQAFKQYQKVLALWAGECGQHVLPYFEARYPEDKRPRKAIETLYEWIKTGEFHMMTIRSASLGAHAAAKGRKQADAVFAAHTAGQAVGTAHVATHALGAALYGIRAVAAHSGNIDDGLVRERGWQLARLQNLRAQNSI